MTSVGAAVGLGNIWGFPYRAYRNGGFAFIAVYIVFVLLIGVPLILAELKLGRAFGVSPVKAYRRAGGGFAGYVGLAACLAVLFYYFHFGGLILREIAAGCGVRSQGALIWHLLFAGMTLIIVLAGMKNGVEKVSKVLVPALIAVLAALAVYAFISQGAERTVGFLFRPDLTRLDSETIKSALGQALFSLSLGQCIMVAFGGFLDKNESLMRHALCIPFLDTVVALVACLVVIPFAVEAGSPLSAGPSLLFDSMPDAFAGMKHRKLISLAFFVPVFFAALTSAVSMLEVPVTAVVEDKGVSRKKACAALAVSAVICGLPLCRDISFYRVYEFVSEKILMTSCSLVTCLLFIGSKRNSLPELAPKSKTERLFTFILRFVTPAILIASAFV